MTAADPALQRFVAIDVETTGLHPVDDAILEFALVLPTDDLLVGDVFGSRVVSVLDPRVDLDRMIPFVERMHEDSGLRAEVEGSDLLLDEIDAEASAWLVARGFGPDSERQGIILGSSCRLDLYMIELQMPRTARLLTHRMGDASGYREMVRHFALERAELLTPVPPEDLAGLEGQVVRKHRALYDAVQTIAEARAQRDALRRVLGLRG